MRSREAHWDHPDHPHWENVQENNYKMSKSKIQEEDWSRNSTQVLTKIRLNHHDVQLGDMGSFHTERLL